VEDGDSGHEYDAVAGEEAWGHREEEDVRTAYLLLSSVEIWRGEYDQRQRRDLYAA